MKRIMLLVVGILMALVVAAPMVSAPSNGEAPEDASGAIVLHPGDYPGSCEFPFNLELAAKRELSTHQSRSSTPPIPGPVPSPQY